jgi:hypothetical protein
MRTLRVVNLLTASAATAIIAPGAKFRCAVIKECENPRRALGGRAKHARNSLSSTLHLGHISRTRRTPGDYAHSVRHRRSLVSILASCGRTIP